ncbi:LysR family transcriptional regulator [Shouchella sp. 1P09AA]|uniref:LysR family transcriptional regulator n=1 Tax=unclassified Shouchella TaxID=2893065 RepID=UPI0039A0441F
MDRKHLKTFLDVCETLNFTKTAERLQYAQSSITAQMKSLEHELQCSLFQRLGKKITLTKAGEQLRPYAHQLIQLEENARLSLLSQKETIVIGAQESQCTYRLPTLLHTFTQQNPTSKLVFKPAHSDKLATESLLNGEIDLAFIMDVTTKERPLLHTEALIEERLLMVVAPDHPFAIQRNISPEELESEAILFTEKGCSYRVLLENLLHKAHVTPKSSLEFTSLEAIKKCVVANIGIAFLPELVVKAEVREGLLCAVSLDATFSTLKTHLAYHKDKQMSAGVQQFLQLTRAFFKNS